MGMLAIHMEALKSNSSAYHEFLGVYKKFGKTIYGFVEGPEDPVFYSGHIDSLIPEDWELKLFASGGKAEVYSIYKSINWRRFRKKRVCFFVDRDLSEIIPEELVSDANIYTTTDYSVENYLVKPYVFKRMMKEIYGFHDLDEKKLQQLTSLFEKQLERFTFLMMPIMSIILKCRREGASINLNNAKLSKIFLVKDGVVSEVDDKNTINTFCRHCGLHSPNNIDFSNEEIEFGSKERYRRLVRGKYLLWFLIEFCASAHRDVQNVLQGTNKPKVKIALSHSNGMCVAGNRGRMPTSLRKFIELNYLTYISSTK